MQLLAKFRAQYGTFRSVAFFFVVYTISQAAIGSILHAMGAADFLHAQTTFSRETYLAYVARWQAEGLMDNYRNHFYLDFIHPIWYTFLLASMLAHGLKCNRSSGQWNWVLVIPFIAGAMDVTENIMHVIFLADLQAITDPMIVAGALAANTKWALVTVSLLGSFGLYGRSFLRRSCLA
jgi:hypothetical protein